MSDLQPDTPVTADPDAVSLRDLVARAVLGGLSADDAEAAFGEVMAGRASAVQIAALLTSLRARGETPQEVAGGVRALRSAMVPVEVDPDLVVVDTCGTGGGTLTTFNISTAAALVAAGGGVIIAKHGNRSFSSRCGSADVIEALGVRIEMSAEEMATVLARAGIVFMFAPLLHPAMRHVAPVRRELGVPTIMNLLGPLTNPAGARRQIIGVSDAALIPLVAGGLRELGHAHALVVHGAPGMDELSPIGETAGLELRDGELREFRVAPATFDWPRFAVEDLAGGGPEENAALIRDILDGGGPPGARAAVLINAAAALYVGGLVDSLEEGVRLAERVVDEGAGRAKLEELKSAAAAAANEAKNKTSHAKPRS